MTLALQAPPGNLQSKTPVLRMPHECLTHWSWVGFLSQQDWDYFVTLTAASFLPKSHPRNPLGLPDVPQEMTHDAWRGAFKEYQKRLTIDEGRRRGVIDPPADFDQAYSVRALSGPIAGRLRRGRDWPQYVFCSEPHASGKLHVHGLLRLPAWWRNKSKGIRHRIDYEAAQRLWARDGRGAVLRFEVPRDRTRVVSYCASYMTKGGTDALEMSANFRVPLLRP